MRWAAMFADLEAQLEAAERAELAAEVADRSRWEVGRLHVADRLRAAVGAGISLAVTGGQVLTGEVTSVGADWVLLSVPGQPDALVPLPAVQWVRGLPAAAVPSGDEPVAGRLDLRYLLRVLGRDRAAVTVTLTDGGCLTGTVDRVGGDFADVAEHAIDEARRAGAAGSARTVPLAAIAVVRPA